MNKYFIFVVCFFLLCYAVPAQTSMDGAVDFENIEDTLEENTTDIQPDTNFYFSGFLYQKQNIDSLKKLNAYHYISTIENYLKAQKNISLKKIQNPQNTSSENGQKQYKTSWLQKMTSKWEFNFMLWMLAIFFIVMLCYFFIVRNRIFSKRSSTLAVNIEPENNEIEMHDYEKAYLSAKMKNDFRTAIKFLFLHTLYLLSQKDLVSFSPDKTNHDYFLELPSTWQKDFASISLAYEYIWYGRQVLDIIQFGEKEKIFSQLIDRIKQI